MKLVVKKALNNNVLLVNTPDHEKRIIMGAGIGWGIKPGNIIDSNNKKIDQVFVVEDQAYTNTFQEMLQRGNIDYIKLANEIIESGEKVLGYKCSFSLRNIQFSLFP